MTTVILVIHLLIAIALVGVILIQRSEGGGLGMGGGGMSGFMTGRATANLLTRTTSILALAFMSTSLVLAILAKGTHEKASILDQPSPVPVQEPAPEPVKPILPSVPLAK
jgi:preprotein translocase subunit SecG